jgi:mRNA interferase RelE/StbE
MNFEYSNKSIKTIDSIDTVLKQRMKAAIEKLPYGDIRLVKGQKVTTYRLRVGVWRVVYCFLDKETIFIEKIAPRGKKKKKGV